MGLYKKAIIILLSTFLFFATAVADATAADATSAYCELTSIDPMSEFQASIDFPDWAGYVDNTLLMNSEYSFKAYSGQGYIYVTIGSNVESFNLYINSNKIDTQELAAGNTYKIDCSNYFVDGTNTVHVSNNESNGADKKIHIDIPYPGVIDGTLEEVGINPSALDALDAIIQADVDNGFTSAQLAVIKNGRLVYQNAWGNISNYNTDGSPIEDGIPATNDTLYDLASNTKAFATNYAVQYLIDQGLLSFNTRVVEILGTDFAEWTLDFDHIPYDLDTEISWKYQLTVQNLMRHESGFPASTRMYDESNSIFAGNDSSRETRNAALESIFKTPLSFRPGTAVSYSDLNYIVLGFIVEIVTGKLLDDYLEEIFWTPMGLERITYNPLVNGFSKEDCAATEINGNTRAGTVKFENIRTSTIQGEVHDEIAYYCMGGISGHAGLFSNATDLAKLGTLMLTGGFGEKRYFSDNMLDYVTAPISYNYPEQATGWIRQADNSKVYYYGTQANSSSFGHNGWTGTLTLIDPEEDLVLVYLTNICNSPIYDPLNNYNKFSASDYTSGTLGIAAELIYLGIEFNNADMSEALNNFFQEMILSKEKLIDIARSKIEATNYSATHCCDCSTCQGRCNLSASEDCPDCSNCYIHTSDCACGEDCICPRAFEEGTYFDDDVWCECLEFVDCGSKAEIALKEFDESQAMCRSLTALKEAAEAVKK